MSNEAQLLVAVRRGDTASVATLLEEGAACATVNSWGQTLLHEAAGQGCVEIVRLILQHLSKVPFRHLQVPVGIYAKDAVLGDTPLHYAVYYKHAAVVKLLLDAHASVVLANNEKETPIAYAKRYGAHEIMPLLLDRLPWEPPATTPAEAA